MPKICCIDGCAKPVSARGWCKMHYTRWLRHGSPFVNKNLIVAKNKGMLCQTVGCDNYAMTRGYCQKHYARWLRYGSPYAHGTGRSRSGNRHGHSRMGGTSIRISNPREYSSYQAMKTRCYNRSHQQYKDYGGRGVKVCDRWLGENGFQHFLEDMGPRPEGMSIDRIDVNGDYCPENCRWATAKEQASNRRAKFMRLIEYNGELKSMSEWARELGFPVYLLFNRIDIYHWSTKKAFETPWKKKPRKNTK